jgi:exodeoxyribonuclease VII small subunit
MKALTYEKAYSDLEEIVTLLESENVPLDLLEEKIKNATTLIQFCQTKLRSTEEEFKKALAAISRTE